MHSIDARFFPEESDPGRDSRAGVCKVEALEAKPASEKRPRVVIVGGGFGGLSAATSLSGAPVDIVLVDRRNYHVLQPLL